MNRRWEIASYVFAGLFGFLLGALLDAHFYDWQFWILVAVFFAYGFAVGCADRART